MKVLHLTDFHFLSKGKKILLKDKHLSNALQEILKDQEIDFIFFTGDLVDDGSNKDWFKNAFDLIFNPFIEDGKVLESNIFFCQGNHDVDRGVIRQPFIKYIDEEIIDNEGLNAFVGSNKKDFIDTLESSKNYYDFLSTIDYEKEDYLNEMYTVHKRKIDNLSLGIVTINTSWKSNGDDKNKLLFPTKLLEEALDRIKGVDKRVLLHHHPITDLKEQNSYVLEDIIHNEFDICFYGHKHKGLTTFDFTPNTGIVKIMSPAALKRHEAGEIGFSLLEFDFKELEFSLSKYLYNERDNFFYIHPETHKHDMPQSSEAREQNKFRKKIRSLIDREKEKARNLIVTSEDQEKGFIDLFVDPILKKQNEEETTLKSYSVEEIIYDNKDYLIAGDDKSGKTSLLKKCFLDILNQFENKDYLPFYLDFKQEGSNIHNINIENRIRQRFEINRKKAVDLLTNKKIVLLIDNLNNQDERQIGFLQDVTSKYSNLKLIMTISQSTDLIYNPPKVNSREITILRFVNLRKKQIRELTQRWVFLDNSIREEIVQKIESIFIQLSIPFNFWTVSLFLYVFKKSGVKSIQNNVGLVNLYIESLLERENLIKSNANFAYEKYLNLLARLAHFLFKNHLDTVYSAPELVIINFIDNHLKGNPRNQNINPLLVWNYLKDRSIFMKVENEYFGFRLNGVFEFFLAYYMKLDPSFLDEIMTDEYSYLAFKNEFEIYSGFSRDDEKFLDRVFSKSETMFNDLNNEYKGETIDYTLKNRLILFPNYEQKINELSAKARSLTIDEQDEIENIASELGIDKNTIEGVKKKEPIDFHNDQISYLEDALFILGRVFRNIDEINDKSKVDKIFAYYLKTLCNWGFRVIDISKTVDFESNFNEKSEVELLYQLMSKVVPYLVQTIASEQINQKNLDGIIQNRITILKDSEDGGRENQFELFILYLMLIDLNIKGSQKLIDEIIEFISIPILRFSILIKLNKYLVFNTSEDKDFEIFIRNSIQKVQLQLNSSLDLGYLHQNLSQKGKQKLLRKE